MIQVSWAPSERKIAARRGRSASYFRFGGCVKTPLIHA
jgi:hypothetical protein